MKKTIQTMLTAAAFAAALGIASPDPGAAQITASAEDAGLNDVTSTTTQTVYGPPWMLTETTTTTLEPQPVYGPPPARYPLGDLNEDDQLDSRDLSLMLRRARREKDNPGLFYKMEADMNSDGLIDKQDVDALLAHISRRSEVSENEYGVVNITIRPANGENEVEQITKIEIEGEAYPIGYMEKHDTLDGAKILEKQTVTNDDYFIANGKEQSLVQIYVPATTDEQNLKITLYAKKDGSKKERKVLSTTLNYYLMYTDTFGTALPTPLADFVYDGIWIDQGITSIIMTSTTEPTAFTTTTTTTRKTRPTQTTETTLLTTVSVPTALYSAPLTSDITSISTTTGTTRKTRPVSTTTTEDTVLTTTELPQPVYGPPPSDYTY